MITIGSRACSTLVCQFRTPKSKQRADSRQGYLAWEYPTNRLLQRLPLAKYSSFCIIMWGLVLCCMAALQNYSGAIAVRFFLGVFEAAVTPGFSYFTSQVGLHSSISHVLLTACSGTPGRNKAHVQGFGSASMDGARSSAVS